MIKEEQCHWEHLFLSHSFRNKKFLSMSKIPPLMSNTPKLSRIVLKQREVYGRREKRGREAGEKEKNYATLRSVSQSKKCKGAGAKKYRAGTGIKGYGKREV